eukprot:scaffold476253_cov41-Prasinocladus_malaysianus.AAC.1
MGNELSPPGYCLNPPGATTSRPISHRNDVSHATWGRISLPFTVPHVHKHINATAVYHDKNGQYISTYILPGGRAIYFSNTTIINTSKSWLQSISPTTKKAFFSVYLSFFRQRQEAHHIIHNKWDGDGVLPVSNRLWPPFGIASA